MWQRLSSGDQPACLLLILAFFCPHTCTIALGTGSGLGIVSSLQAPNSKELSTPFLAGEEWASLTGILPDQHLSTHANVQKGYPGLVKNRSITSNFTDGLSGLHHNHNHNHTNFSVRFDLSVDDTFVGLFDAGHGSLSPLGLQGNLSGITTTSSTPAATASKVASEVSAPQAFAGPPPAAIQASSATSTAAAPREAPHSGESTTNTTKPASPHRKYHSSPEEPQGAMAESRIPSWTGLESILPALPPELFVEGLPGGFKRWAKIHPIDLQTPLRIWVYPLPRMFHHGIVKDLLKGLFPSKECTPLSWPCTMDSPPQAKTKSGYYHAIFWQYLAEVVILQKFLSLGALQVSPEEADVLIVPAFLSAGSSVAEYVRGNAKYRAPGARTTPKSFTFQDLLGQLEYYGNRPDGQPKVRGKHLFLRTSDCHWWGNAAPAEDVPCDWKSSDFRMSPQDLFVTLGARNRSSPLHSGHIIVPPLVMEKELQPSSWGSDRVEEDRGLLLFLQCSPGIMRERQLFVDSISKDTYRDPDRIVLVKMSEDSRQPKLSQLETLRSMRNSTFCPVPSGDLPFTTRYFFAVLSGCIPVVLLHPGRGGGNWWSVGGPPVEDSVPWANHPDIDHRKFVVEISYRDLHTVVPRLQAMPKSEIVRRRQAIFEARAKLVYDFAGSSPDAFSTLLMDLEARLRLDRRDARPTKNLEAWETPGRATGPDTARMNSEPRSASIELPASIVAPSDASWEEMNLAVAAASSSSANAAVGLRPHNHSPLGDSSSATDFMQLFSSFKSAATPATLDTLSSNITPSSAWSMMESTLVSPDSTSTTTSLTGFGASHSSSSSSSALSSSTFSSSPSSSPSVATVANNPLNGSHRQQQQQQPQQSSSHPQPLHSALFEQQHSKQQLQQQQQQQQTPLQQIQSQTQAPDSCSQGGSPTMQRMLRSCCGQVRPGGGLGRVPAERPAPIADYCQPFLTSERFKSCCQLQNLLPHPAADLLVVPSSSSEKPVLLRQLKGLSVLQPGEFALQQWTQVGLPSLRQMLRQRPFSAWTLSKKGVGLLGVAASVLGAREVLMLDEDLSSLALARSNALVASGVSSKFAVAKWNHTRGDPLPKVALAFGASRVDTEWELAQNHRFVIWMANPSAAALARVLHDLTRLSSPPPTRHMTLLIALPSWQWPSFERPLAAWGRIQAVASAENLGYLPRSTLTKGQLLLVWVDLGDP